MSVVDRFQAQFPRATANTPPNVTAALAAQGMDGEGYLPPGQPLTPVQGYNGTPRRMDYPVGVNLSTVGRTAWEGRTSFAVIRGIIDAYDVARACINHKIDEIRSMEPLITPMDDAKGDTDLAVRVAKKALEKPDREHYYDEWLGLWLNDQCSIDAGALKTRRNRSGQAFGLEVVNAETIQPLIDGYGRRPKAPAPAYQQVIKGVVTQDFIADDLRYVRFRPQTRDPYGLSPIESVMLNANTDLRFQWHLLQMFTEGSIPAGFMEVPPDISNPDQIAEWQDYWDATFMGDQSILHKLVAVPNGAKFTGTRPAAFDKAFPDQLARKTAMACGVVAQDIGLLSDINRATGETQTDTQFRVNTLPWVNLVQRVFNSYLQDDLHLPVQVNLNTGRDKEDRLTEAQAWKIYVETGFASMDEAREELLGLPSDPLRPIPRGIITTRIPFTPLDSVLAVSGAVDPETKAPADDVPVQMQLPAAGMIPPPVEPPNLEQPAQPTPVAKEIAKWRASSKSRVKQGRPAKRFESDVIPESTIDVIWSHLAKASTTAEVDAAFGADIPKVSGWRADPPVSTPQHAVDLQLTDYWTPRITAAFRGMFTAAQLADAVSMAYARAGTVQKDDSSAVAADLAVVADTAELGQTVANVWADSYHAGTMAARMQLEGTGDWGDWAPGFTNPSNITDPGWAAALDDAGITLKGISDTTFARLGAAIEDGVVAGASHADLAKTLTGILTDPVRAELVAHTEAARMLTNASMAQYRDYGVTQWDLVISAGACPICTSVAAANPHPASDSGDTPPLHPRCRCATSPATKDES